MSIETGSLLAQLLLTIATVGYGGITILADFNATHATNPTWPPHARFHLVWQILSFSGIGLIALALIWSAGPMHIERLYLAAGLAFVIYGAFYVAMLARPLYGGAMFDANGYVPFKPPLAPAAWRWDVNIVVFSVFSAILAAGVVAA